MSISLCVVVAPSTWLRSALLAFGAAQFAAAALFSLGLCGPFYLPQLPVGCSMLAALALLRARALALKWHQIDISGLGQIRLTVQLETGTGDALGATVQLLPGSTLWAQLLVLRLRDEQGLVRVLLIAPDSVAPGVFRCLVTALRDIARRDRACAGARELL